MKHSIMIIANKAKTLEIVVKITIIVITSGPESAEPHDGP